MGLEQLKKEILDKAQREAAQLRKEAEREAEAILNSAKEKAKLYRQEAEAKQKLLLEEIEKSESANARFEARKLLLDEKKTFIERTFAAAEEKLAALPEKKREAIISKAIAAAKKEIGVKIVYANLMDKKIVEKAGFRFQQMEMLGGIIAETADGTVRVDHGFAEQLREIKEHKLQDIARKLF